MGHWEDNLLDASFAGISFPVGERSVSGGRAFARHRPLATGGQRTQDTGREPYSLIYTVPLFRGVDPTHYPDTFNQLRVRFDDAEGGAVGELVDPELGPFTARVTGWKWTTDPMARDGGIFSLQFEEETDENDPIPDPADTRPVLASSITSSADEADAELDALGVDSEQAHGAMRSSGVPTTQTPRDGQTVRGIVDGVVSAVQQAASTAETVLARVEYTLAQLGALAAYVSQLPDGWLAYGALLDTQERLRLFADSRLARGPALVSVVLDSPRSAYEITVAQYGSLDRIDEVLGRVGVVHPCVLPAGVLGRIRVR